MSVEVRCYTNNEADMKLRCIGKILEMLIGHRLNIKWSLLPTPSLPVRAHRDGIDFNKEHFDCIFVFVNNRCGPVQNIKQMMGRSEAARKLRTGFIFLYIRMADYHYIISYKIIKSGIINRKLSYLDTLEKKRSGSKRSGKPRETQVSAMEMCLRFNDIKGYIASNLLCVLNITKI